MRSCLGNHEDRTNGGFPVERFPLERFPVERFPVERHSFVLKKAENNKEYDNTFKHVNTALYCIILIHGEILMYVRELHYSGWNKGVWGSDGPGRHRLNNCKKSNYIYTQWRNYIYTAKKSIDWRKRKLIFINEN